MGSAVVHLQQPSPTLKKRASIRDRFRSLAKDTPSPAPEPEKQRTVYVPSHAAADFSRLAVSPRPVSRQQQRYSYDKPRALSQPATEQPNPIAALHLSDNEPQRPADPRHYSQRGLETLDEIESVRVQGQIGQRVPEIDAPQLESPLDNSRQQRQGQAAISDFSGPSSNNTVSLIAHVSETPKHDQAGAAQEKGRQQLSDYELFLARAEERERTHREHLLRTLSQRQYPRPEPEIIPYQPRNSATYTADSAVVAEAVGHPRKGRTSVLDSGIGSRSSSHLQTEEPAAAAAHVSGTWERGHRKRGSWTPSFGAGGRDVERRLEREGADVVPEEETFHGGTYTTLHRNNTSSYADRSYAAQQPMTLKRQTSIKQKLGAYIKPARPPTRYEEPEVTRGKSMMRT